MNELYEQLGALDTAVTPLDEAALDRVTRRALRAMPGRKRRRWLPLAVAATLLLSACGFAVATGQFAKWFDGIAPQGMNEEAAAAFFAGMGTVVDQTVTADGVTLTLDAALYDSKTLALAFSMTGEGLCRQAMAIPGPNRIRLEKPGERKALRQTVRSMSEAEIEEWLDTYARLNFSRQSWYRFDSDANTATLLLFCDEALPAGESELKLCIEDLQESGGKTLLKGPFDFTFSVENRETALVLPGPVEITAENGVVLTLTDLTVRAFGAEVSYTTAETDSDRVHEALELGGVRVGETVFARSGGGTKTEELPDGGFQGNSTARGFHTVIDPAAVDAVQIGGTWVERSAFGEADDS